MTHYSIREWEYLDVDNGDRPGAMPRAAADSLVAAARATRLGGEDGQAILVNGHRRLRAQQMVGILATRSATLEVLPKIDGLDEGATRQCLVHMLARSFDIDVSSTGLTKLGWQSRDLLEIFIRLFCDQLFDAVHLGLPRSYQTRQDDIPALRGRLDIKRQFTTRLAAPQKLACRFNERSSDIALNQIMKAAVRSLLDLSQSNESRRRLGELAAVYADVTAVPVRMLPWQSVILDRTNSAWANLLGLAQLLLGERFQTTSTGDQQGFSLLFPMNTLFEEFVGRSLRHSLAGLGVEVKLQGPRSFALVASDGSRRFATYPDIVVSRGGEPVLIIDTKWKRLSAATSDSKQGVGQSDVYQMMAYAQVYQCPNLMLLYPHHSGLDSNEGVLASYRVGGTPDTRLNVATLSVGDWRSVGNRLLRVLRTTGALH